MRLRENIQITFEPEDEKFNFELTASAYSFSWNFDGKYYQTIIKDNENIVLGIKTWKQDRRITVKTYLNDKTNREHIENIIIEHLGLNEKLDEFYQLCRSDPLLREAPEGIHTRKVDIWYASIIAIAQQNASFRQGWSMIWRLLSRYGEKFLIDNKVIILPPSPSNIVERGETILRDSGFGYRSRALVSIAKILVENGEEYLRKNLKNIKGVGPYTYGLIMMLSYRDYTNPVIDRWVKGLYNSVGILDVEKYYEEHWGKYKALATWMLTIVLDAEPLSKAVDRVRKGILKPTFKGLTPLTLWKYY